MPRTVNSIVESHRVASERRAVGRPVWDHKLPIRHLFEGGDLEETAPEVGRKVAEVLRASSWFRAKGGAGTDLDVLADALGDIEDLDHLQLALDDLYDLADADRTWVE